MKTSVHLWYDLAEFFLEWEMFQKELVRKIKTHILCHIMYFFPPKSCHLRYNLEKCVKIRRGHRRQYNTEHAHCMLVTKGTNTHTEYVILSIFFPCYTDKRSPDVSLTLRHKPRLGRLNSWWRRRTNAVSSQTEHVVVNSLVFMSGNF